MTQRPIAYSPSAQRARQLAAQRRLVRKPQGFFTRLWTWLNTPL